MSMSMGKSGRVSGRTVLITGGARGMGEAHARLLVAEGARVVVGDILEEEGRALAKELGPDAALFQPLDVTSEAAWQQAVSAAEEAFGPVSGLVNNAGITVDKTVAKMTDEDWNKVIAVNLSGAFFLGQAALAHMLERGSGRIVIVSSVIGEIGAIGQANYAASKAGLFGLTKTLAREACFQLARGDKLSEDGIGVTVNTVAPGYVATDMVGSIPEKVLDRIKGTIPVRRLARPEEIARVVHFLAADASGYVTGQIWGVNGGLDM
jgi:acetoacetyl-CoA reductase/3-oxoacyl-[acyl-carrier protein] reductase